MAKTKVVSPNGEELIASVTCVAPHEWGIRVETKWGAYLYEEGPFYTRDEAKAWLRANYRVASRSKTERNNLKQGGNDMLARWEDGELARIFIDDVNGEFEVMVTDRSGDDIWDSAGGFRTREEAMGWIKDRDAHPEWSLMHAAMRHSSSKAHRRRTKSGTKYNENEDSSRGWYVYVGGGSPLVYELANDEIGYNRELVCDVDTSRLGWGDSVDLDVVGFGYSDEDMQEIDDYAVEDMVFDALDEHYRRMITSRKMVAPSGIVASNSCRRKQRRAESINEDDFWYVSVDDLDGQLMYSVCNDARDSYRALADVAVDDSLSHDDFFTIPSNMYGDNDSFFMTASSSRIESVINEMLNSGVWVYNYNTNSQRYIEQAGIVASNSYRRIR